MVHSTSPRDRLIGGMAAAIRERGFRATTVADVVRHARTSRRTFYEHFADREACLLALFEQTGEELMAHISEAARAEGAWAERVDAAIGAYLDDLTAEPELTRCALVDVPATGERGVAHRAAFNDRCARQLVALADEARAEDPGLRPLSVEAALMIIGGLHELITHATEEGRTPAQLRPVASELVWRLVAGGEPPAALVAAAPHERRAASGSSRRSSGSTDSSTS